MKCRKGEVLYIGKATSLRDRVRSYRCAKPGKVGPNIIKLLDRVRTIEWEEHASEHEAYGRELELIRALTPRYNIADKWEERYFFIGLRRSTPQLLDFRLTHKEEDAHDFDLHGCYPRRFLVKGGYSALLRILFACTYRGTRFSFPARIARPYPAYEYSLKVDDASKWKRMISEFLHGQRSRFLHRLVDELLANPQIPEYVRPGIQRDILALRSFEQCCLRLEKIRSKADRRMVSHRELRSELKASIRISPQDVEEIEITAA